MSNKKLSPRTPTQKSLASSATVESLSSPVHQYDGDDLMLEFARDRVERRASLGNGSLTSMPPNNIVGGGGKVTRQRSLRGSRDVGCNSPAPTERGSICGLPGGMYGDGGGRTIISKSAQAAQIEKHATDAKFVEKDVDGNFLTESHFYRGFYYMMGQHDDTSELAIKMREELFPELALALEAVLHDAVKEQLEKELKLRKQQQQWQMAAQASHHGGSNMSLKTMADVAVAASASYASMSHSGIHGPHAGGVSERSKSLRQHPTYPAHPLKASTTEVHPVIMLARELKKRSKTYLRENPPQEKASTPPHNSLPMDESFAEMSDSNSPTAAAAAAARAGSVKAASMKGSMKDLGQTPALGETLPGATILSDSSGVASPLVPAQRTPKFTSTNVKFN